MLIHKLIDKSISFNYQSLIEADLTATRHVYRRVFYYPHARARARKSAAKVA